MNKIWLLLALGVTSLGVELPRVLFFSNPMQSDNDVIRRTNPTTLSVAETNFARIANGVFNITLTQEGSNITATALKEFDAVIFFTAINPPGVDLEGLAKWVRAGGAFVAIHSTANTYQGVPVFGEMLGARFERRPWRTREAPQTKARVIVNDPAHRATTHLPSGWAIEEDLYVYKNFDTNGVHVLLSLDPMSLDMSKASGLTALPIAWTKTYGTGRMFYTMLGDWEPTWRDKQFEKHLVEGIRWATEAKKQTTTR